jgi:hypothetical protein
LHSDRGRILVLRDTTPLQRPRRVNFFVRLAEVSDAMEVDDLIAKYQSPHSVPPMPALEGLDEVNWAALNDAYGPATNVPALLRAFVSVDPGDREFADELLCQTIWHQGNVYSATAAAVPFLYNLLEDDGPHNKKAVVGVISLIADGLPPYLSCADDPKQYAFWDDILRQQGKSLEDRIAEGRQIARDVRGQLARRAELLRECCGGQLPAWAIQTAEPSSAPQCGGIT